MNSSAPIEALYPFEWQFILMSGCRLYRNQGVVTSSAAQTLSDPKLA
jgi:hypothetical protein